MLEATPFDIMEINKDYVEIIDGPYFQNQLISRIRMVT